jgi:hypothetical protein
MAAVANDIGRLACTFTECAAVVASFSCLAFAGRVFALLVFSHYLPRELDSRGLKRSHFALPAD